MRASLDISPKGVRLLPRGRGAKMVVGLILLVGSLLFPQIDISEKFDGRVIGITDGDTLTVLVGMNNPVKIRLAEIDAPESSQPYGTRAREELSSLTFGQEAHVSVKDKDRYGRTVGRVYVGDLDVNAEMVKRGAAWVYGHYANDIKLYYFQSLAKSEKRGLWSLPERERTPPWEWRHEKKR